MATPQHKIKEQIISALRHPEAEEGLYFNNLIVVHEDEERPIVVGTEEEVKAVIEAMIKEGVLTSEGQGNRTVYKLR